MTEKDRILEAVRGLPDDASGEDAIESLCFLAKVTRGLKELDSAPSVARAEVKRKLVGG